MWRYIYNGVQNAPLETLFTFDDLSKMINAQILQNRSSLYRASKELMVIDKKILISEAGVGYRLVDGVKHFAHAKDRHKRADRQIVKAGFEANNLNTVAMTPDQRQEWQQFIALNGSIMSVMRQSMKNVATASEISNAYVQDQFKKMEETMSSFTEKLKLLDNKLKE